MRKAKFFVSIAALLLVVAMVAQAAVSPEVAHIITDGTDLDSPFSLWQSNRYTHSQNTSKNSVQLSTIGFEKVAENSNFAMFIRESDASMRVLNKNSGYVWGTPEFNESSEMNDVWASFANGIVGIDYFDKSAAVARMGIGHEETTWNFTYEKNKVILDANFDSIGISFTVNIELVRDGIIFSLDDDSIWHTDVYTLGNLYFAPFMGATYSDKVPGYIFVPDGSGALIRYNKPGSYISGYSGRVYGLDYAIDSTRVANDIDSERPNDFMKSEETVSMPVYGMVHGVKQNALFGVIEKGADYATICATPAGFNTDYNWACVGFVYRQAYILATKRDGSGFNVSQQNPNKINPKLHIYLLDDEQADYVGMANLYRELLIKDDKLAKASNEDAPTLALDFIMEDISDGFLMDTVKEITSLEYVENAAKTLKESGIDKMHISLKGWQKGGLNNYDKNQVYKSANFGSFSKLDAIKNVLEDSGEISLYIDPLKAKLVQINKTSEAAINLSQTPISIVREDKKVFLGDTWFVKYPLAMQNLLKQYNAFKKQGVSTPVIDSGNLLYGEYLEDSFASRSNIRTQTEKVFAKIASKDKLTIFRPNEYLFAYTDEYRDAPMSSSQYIYETDSVPFLQIVLSGSMTLYAPYANESFYSMSSVLKSIEYNCYPSFILTEAENTDLRKTAISELNSTCFDDWNVSIVEIHNLINSVLSNVRGQSIVNHNVVRDGVVEVEYEKGGSIYVNYGLEDAVVDGITIPALSAVYSN